MALTEVELVRGPLTTLTLLTREVAPATLDKLMRALKKTRRVNLVVIWQSLILMTTLLRLTMP